MMGLSTIGNISLGCALVAGKKRVPRPAAGRTALRTRRAAGIFASVESTIRLLVPSLLFCRLLFLRFFRGRFLCGSFYWSGILFFTFLTDGVFGIRRGLLGISARGLLRVVGHIPSGALELDSRRCDLALHLAAAMGAFFQMRAGNFFDPLRKAAAA